MKRSEKGFGPHGKKFRFNQKVLPAHEPPPYIENIFVPIRRAVNLFELILMLKLQVALSILSENIDITWISADTSMFIKRDT